MDGLARDFLYACRLVLKQPVFTALVIISLTLGIGANTTIFTLVDAFFLRPLPYVDPDDLVMVWFTPPSRPLLDEGGRGGATRRNCMELRQRSRSLDVICLQHFELNMAQDGQGSSTERVLGQEFSGDLPKLTGLKPLIGRWFTTEEERYDAAPVVLISYGQWQKRFAGSPDVLGKQLRLDSTLASIVGVMPKDFSFYQPNIEYWAPFRNPPNVAGSPVRFLLLPARLKKGVTLEQAQSEMDALSHSLAEEFPATNKEWRIRLEPLRNTLTAGVGKPLMIFEGAVAFVLLIACANVAGLFLAQGSAQQREMALRLALGSTRWQLIRQLLAESITLSVLGGILGIIVAFGSLQMLVNLLPPLPAGRISIDRNVLSFTLLLSVATGIAIGTLPALQLSRPDIIDTLRDGTRTTATRARQRLRSVFVVVQLSLAMVLLTGCCLMLKSFLKLHAIDYGFPYKDLTTFQIQFPRGEFSKISDHTTPAGGLTVEISPRINIVTEEIRQRLAAIVDVQHATASVIAPLGGFSLQYAFTIEGRPAIDPEREALRTEWNAVFPDYFETLGIPILLGRQFAAQDFAGGPPVVVINEAMAKSFWPNANPIGKRIRSSFYKEVPREIIGIVGDVRQAVRQDGPRPQIYVPFSQLPLNQEGRGLLFIAFVVRSSGQPAQLIPAMRDAVARVDGRQAIYDVRPVEQNMNNQMVGDRIYLMLLTVFAGIAILLSIVGVYGIVSHAVTQRTNEIGIRICLGARSWDVFSLILHHGLFLIGLGLVIGASASLVLTKALASVLWQVTPIDPPMYVLASTTLALVAVLACYIPARRVLTISPVVALRES